MSAPFDPGMEARSYPVARTDYSPVPSLGPDSVITDALDQDDSARTAGRKRKLNSTSSRGVANLTPDQLAKKRANDRQAQRAIRERTKSHIEALEQQVRDLSSQKPFLDLQAAVQHNERIREENKELRQGLQAALDIIQPLLAKPAAKDLPSFLTQPRSVPSSNEIPPFPDSDRLTPIKQGATPADKQYADSVASVDTPSPTHSAPTLGSRRNSGNGGIHPTFRMALSQNIAHGLDFGLEERLGFNFLLDPSKNVPKVERLRRSSSETIRTLNSNPPSTLYLQHHCAPNPGMPSFTTPIKNTAPTCTLDSILLDFLHNRQNEAAQGIPRQKLVGPPYPSVSSLLNPEKSFYSHPVSKVFTDILRTFPDISSLPEQVAVLYIMFLLMRWQIFPTQENYERLPEWLTPTSTQQLQPHPAWIDYVPWPRMRDKVVKSHAEFPFENWFIPYTQGMSVNWPYEATDCLLSTGESDELLINPVFERHMRNLSNWSLGPSFAECYPNLVDTTVIRSELKQTTSTLPR
ncbi:hypothetical protein N7495_002458 [Penicillium taxi]|uniref:uncharacterized protein n=1 Tax=Penicillium taxi TaxID=168475 RepID=UPI002544D785|nr:uncharacterized protein N7495_002458 [Penicillium taxi]KAJ5901930.1 hypothetical protein N7495_002458 [Penicillium taxi]